MIDDSASRGEALNLVALFLSDIGVLKEWSEALVNDVAEEAKDREIEVLYVGKKSPDVLLRLPEGTKVWEARIGFETAWKETSGDIPSFVSRSARSVAVAYFKGKQAFESQGIQKRGKSAGVVFIETRAIEEMLLAEGDRLRTALEEAGGQDLAFKKAIDLGDIFVVKKGKEWEQPSFARVARIVHECYRPVLEKQFHIAGRGLQSSLKGLHNVIEEIAPRTVVDAGLQRDIETA